MKKKYWTLLIVGVLVVALVIVLASCGNFSLKDKDLDEDEEMEDLADDLDLDADTTNTGSKTGSIGGNSGKYNGGSGNNGGDAYACARILHLWGIRVDILPLRPVEKLSGDALKNAWICQRLRIPFLENLPDGANYDVVIDGIFGTGLSRAPEGEFAAAIDWINRSGAKVYSVDIPSDRKSVV